MIDQKTKDWILEDLQVIKEAINRSRLISEYYVKSTVHRNGESLLSTLIEDIQSIPVITQVTVEDFKQMISKDTYNLNTPRVATFPFDDEKGSGAKEDK